tara:strand:- start:841 stop:1206 length:366 start_codon:yes stop_codon:yes gene_type:complete
MNWSTYTDDLKIPKNWDCTSYGNDELPSYQVNGFHIWMDSHHVSERLSNAQNIYGLPFDGTMEDLEARVNSGEIGLPFRFTVTDARIYNGETVDPSDHTDQVLLNTNVFEEVATFVEEVEK